MVPRVYVGLPPFIATEPTESLKWRVPGPGSHRARMRKGRGIQPWRAALTPGSLPLMGPSSSCPSRGCLSVPVGYTPQRRRGELKGLLEVRQVKEVKL